MKTLQPLVALVALTLAVPAQAADRLKLLIIDGQNNHNWKAMTPPMKADLEATGRFTVDVATTPDKKAPKDGLGRVPPRLLEVRRRPEQLQRRALARRVQKALEEYVAGGGGLVIIHAANNAFEGWPEWNKMIGLGWREQQVRRSADGRRERQGRPHAQGRGAGLGARAAARLQDRRPRPRPPDHQGHARRVDARQGRALPRPARAGRAHGDPRHRLLRQGRRGAPAPTSR